MSLHDALRVGIAVLALALLFRGQFLGRWSHRRPGHPLLVRAAGLGLLLLVASLVAGDQLNLRGLAVALLVGGLLVVLGPRVVGSRQGRL
jgi:threonine/homoserine efflux transporter RhtA